MTLPLILLILSLPVKPERGGLTFYYGPAFEGQPLYCGGVYEESNGPWIAVDVRWYESGKTLCGDLYYIVFSDGSTMLARARDAGYLADYTVWDTGLSMIADLPLYFRQGRVTATGSIINLSELERGYGWRTY
jgi:hypothetical protein